MRMKIHVLVLDVTPMQMVIMAWILPQSLAGVVYFFLAIFFFQDLRTMCSYAYNLKVYSKSIKMTECPRYCWYRLDTWFATLINGFLSFFYHEFRFCLILGWALDNPSWLKISLLSRMSGEYKDKLYDKYKNKMCAMKIQSSTQRMWRF